MKISLILLTYNEVTGVKEIFKQLPLQYVDEYFAIDGGSIDGTLKLFEKNNIPYFVQNKKGRGEAFRLAFEKATGDALIFFSPDGNEDPKDIPVFIEHLKKNNDLVIASRFMNGSHNEEDDQFFKWRKWANIAFTLIANFIWNKNKYISDTINGYRAITKDAWEKISPDADGYTIEYQISIRSMKNKLKIKEFPTYEYSRIDDQIGSPSIPTGLAFLKLLYQEYFNIKLKESDNK